MSKKQGTEAVDKSAVFTMNMGHSSFKEGDFKDMARLAVKHLHTFCSDVGGGRFEGEFAINPEMANIGFRSNIAPFTLFLYELGVVRRLLKGGNQKYRYFVIDPADFDKVVTDETVGLSLLSLKQGLASQAELGRLKKSPPSKTASKVTAPAPDHLEAMAEMVAEVERLSSVVTQRDQRIAELEKKTVVTPEATAAALIARFRKSKSA